jgi:hypothetical protein
MTDPQHLSPDKQTQLPEVLAARPLPGVEGVVVWHHTRSSEADWDRSGTVSTGPDAFHHGLHGVPMHDWARGHELDQVGPAKMAPAG